MQLDEISHDFPNLTETAMPIKAMKARYYYLQGNKEEAFKMIDQGIKDNPQIYFGENLKAQYLLQENQIDSAYVYAKRAFEGLPNNMPHFDIYMRTLVLKKDYLGINAAFNLVHPLAGETKTVWLIYIRSLAQTRSLGDAFAMEQAAKAYALFPEDENIFLLYRILTYGQGRIAQAEQIYTQANEAYTARNFEQAAQLFKQAFDLDSLNPIYGLNAGLAFYEGKQYDEAIRYFDLSIALKKGTIVERALRYTALYLYRAGLSPEACAVFLKLKNQYPKRMYEQEFQKYCLGKNIN
jgi:tetratricopeptide (TPR) repeat protein